MVDDLPLDGVLGEQAEGLDDIADRQAQVFCSPGAFQDGAAPVGIRFLETTAGAKLAGVD